MMIVMMMVVMMNNDDEPVLYQIYIISFFNKYIYNNMTHIYYILYMIIMEQQTHKYTHIYTYTYLLLLLFV